MKCKDCGTRLKITHVYEAGEQAKTSTAQCPQCKKKYTAVTVLMDGGKGAYAWAKKLKKTCALAQNKVQLGMEFLNKLLRKGD